MPSSNPCRFPPDGRSAVTSEALQRREPGEAALPTEAHEDEAPQHEALQDGGLRVMSTQDFDRWAPVVRRHAIRVARTTRAPPGEVAKLCLTGLHALVDAHAVADQVSPDVEPDRYLEACLLEAMRSHARGRLERVDAAREASERVVRAVARLAVPDAVCTLPRTVIAAELGMELVDYERCLLRTAEAGLARLDWCASEGGESSASAVVELDEEAQRLRVHGAIQGLDERGRTLLELLYERGASLAEAAYRVGCTLQQATIDHADIVHRLRASLRRA